ncbi:hypothetical protein rpr22_0404 [Rickettsia prowazekii str. Rp22]|uniref:Uncharacterized protein n=1 Tax=Rickettsia prowazekii (strain Rp22) TaxID=449216 RepID=D5AWW8_RICPP|nr:hypothetical protein rpr22_0404 [Rickettsia prowazekii str. Rp22]
MNIFKNITLVVIIAINYEYYYYPKRIDEFKLMMKYINTLIIPDILNL